VITALRKTVINGFGQEKRCAPIAHFAEHDKRFMDAAYSRLGVEPATNHCWRCSVQMFRWMQDAGYHSNYSAKLDVVCKHYGIHIPEEERHTAYADVEALAVAVRCMMGSIRRGM
jgi:DNA polymerase III epsilon subunit-like protein